MSKIIHDAFTLLELLITLAIFSLLVIIALPWAKHFGEQAHADKLRIELTEALQLAHHAAQIRGIPITLCASSDLHTCERAWSNGYIIFENREQDGILHDRNRLIVVSQYHQKNAHLFWRSFPYYRSYLLFKPGVGESDNGTFWYCQSNALKPKWAIILNKTGRIRIESSTSTIHDNQGKPLHCNNI